MENEIEKILSVQNNESNAFIKLQQKKLARLKRIKQNKEQGKSIKGIKSIVFELQASGILDDEGNLARPYSDQIQG